jgi:hypothetical protein
VSGTDIETSDAMGWLRVMANAALLHRRPDAIAAA